MSLWESPQAEAALAGRLLVPQDRQFGDYADRMADVIMTLCRVLRQPTSGVLAAIFYSDYLTHRIRLEADTVPGTLPFDRAHRVHGAAYRVLQSAAVSICYGDEPPVVQPPKKPRETQAFLASSVLAPSGIGSYVMTVRTPRALDGPSQGLTGQPVIPQLSRAFGERVAERLFSALEAARESVARARPFDFSRVPDGAIDELVDMGLSANLCEALVELGGGSTTADSHFDMEVLVGVPATESTAEAVKAVSFAGHEISALAQIGEFIKHGYDLREVDVQGTIQTLERAASSGPGVVTIDGQVQGEVAASSRKYRVHLNEADYAMAAVAHTNGQAIFAHGVLSPSGTRFHVRDVSAMRILRRS
ncbi:hypothetical protein KDK95_26555 [Actinospica sp. MGRD01-02]|uniref:Uncharacterized protein n=1 Tax=Actinospica acidithermotolerans TaxID=2828514 RepID=A0A941EBU4_9ACTN|nr:hypothetical protein [Actinospica acidithermotolerans]MBR7829895.1 hypothetical protein [Actinospica acidithermotolerans]